MLAIAGIDDASRRMLGDDMGGARMLVAHDHHVDLVGVQGSHRVDEALALHGCGGRAAEVQAVRGQALLGKLKGAARASRRLVEHIHDRLALQRGDLLDSTLVDLMKRLCGFKDGHDIGVGIFRDVNKMLMVERHRYSPPRGAEPARSPGFMSKISTADVPSTSSRKRRTFSSREDGTFLPT